MYAFVELSSFYVIVAAYGGIPVTLFVKLPSRGVRSVSTELIATNVAVTVEVSITILVADLSAFGNDVSTCELKPVIGAVCFVGDIVYGRMLAGYVSAFIANAIVVEVVVTLSFHLSGRVSAD